MTKNLGIRMLSQQSLVRVVLVESQELASRLRWLGGRDFSRTDGWSPLVEGVRSNDSTVHHKSKCCKCSSANRLSPNNRVHCFLTQARFSHHLAHADSRPPLSICRVCYNQPRPLSEFRHLVIDKARVFTLFPSSGYKLLVQFLAN
jgi:hypothetical protein